LSFARCRACFDDEIGVHCVRRVEWSGKREKTTKYLKQERYNSYRRKRRKIAFCELLGVFRRRNRSAMHSARRMEWKERKKLRNISIKNKITVFVVFDERLRFASCRACFEHEIGVHCVRRVEWSGKSEKTPKYLKQERNNSFRRNRRKIEYCELLGLFRRRNRSALRSARRMEWKERLNCEISQTRTK
jgi:hypothetical protein